MCAKQLEHIQLVFKKSLTCDIERDQSSEILDSPPQVINPISVNIPTLKYK